jgi:16S rRNA (guanine527-N7)-methyltransferase
MNPEELLRKGLKELGIPYTEEHITAFMTYLSELKKWGRAFNLTSLKTDRDIIIKHFLDSLLYLTIIPEGALKLADIGAGAGFPGVPVKIIRPEIETVLVESSRKKAAFLRNIIRHLRLADIHVLEQRIEHLGKEYKNKYDIIASRATFSMREFLTKACPYVKEQGIAILNKGPKISKECKELEESPFYKDAVKEILTLQLPFIRAERNLIVLSCKMLK